MPRARRNAVSASPTVGMAPSSLSTLRATHPSFPPIGVSYVTPRPASQLPAPRRASARRHPTLSAGSIAPSPESAAPNLRTNTNTNTNTNTKPWHRTPPPSPRPPPRTAPELGVGSCCWGFTLGQLRACSCRWSLGLWGCRSPRGRGGDGLDQSALDGGVPGAGSKWNLARRARRRLGRAVRGSADT